MRGQRPFLGLVTGAAFALVSIAPAGASAAAGPAPTAATSVSDAAALLASATPKTVVLDPATGAMLAVTLGEPANLSSMLTPDISSGTNCGSGDGCYYTPVVGGTYHDRSFYGSPGTFSGDWPRRNAWDTGSYTDSACWQSACSQSYGPYTYLTFGGSLVTGTSFTIR